MIDELLEIGPHVTALPVVHGSGDFAWEVRRLMMKHSYDCLAVALPPSFQQATEEAILQLPTPSIVIQRDQKYLTPTRLFAGQRIRRRRRRTRRFVARP